MCGSATSSSKTKLMSFQQKTIHTCFLQMVCSTYTCDATTNNHHIIYFSRIYFICWQVFIYTFLPYRNVTTIPFYHKNYLLNWGNYLATTSTQSIRML